MIPRLETLIYFEKIDSWIISEEIIENGVVLVFKGDVLSDVISLF